MACAAARRMASARRFAAASVREPLTQRGGARRQRGRGVDCIEGGMSLYNPSSDFACLAVSPDEGLPQEHAESGYEAHTNGLYGALTPLSVFKRRPLWPQ